MEYIEVSSKPPKDSTAISLVIGKFDGVHSGHAKLLQKVREYMDCTLAVMSFSDHPNWILKNDVDFQKSLTPLDHKMELLKLFGVERYYNIQFTKQFAQISAKEFVMEHLSRLNIKHIVVGEGFHLGKGRESDTNDLINLCQQIEVPVTVIPLVKANDVKISSTTIRTMIRDGQVEVAQALLGRPYSVIGSVIHGKALGRTLGFPTINLSGVLEQYVLPKPGIYLGVADIYNDGSPNMQKNTLISAGYRPTVDGESYSIEAYLLDFSGDLYGETVELMFHRYLRPELQFSGLDQLVEQMKLDKLYAQTYFETSNNNRKG
ncbi:bifunctional riboflavin kinase/FAD synthetase [Paenibacillus solisilvae]|uniref:Riboflavin biosynthesis protein n=1 Tax=Paenibacillus solisilvae TaxID=2486751 RepID=A0ABW0VZ61_9BACL